MAGGTLRGSTFRSGGCGSRSTSDALLYWIRASSRRRCAFGATSPGRVPIELPGTDAPARAGRSRPLRRILPAFQREANASPVTHPAFEMTVRTGSRPEGHVGHRPVESGRARDVLELLRRERSEYPAGAIRMRFIYNHDYNWNWLLRDRYAGGAKASSPVLDRHPAGSSPDPEWRGGGARPSKLPGRLARSARAHPSGPTTR